MKDGLLVKFAGPPQDPLLCPVTFGGVQCQLAPGHAPQSHICVRRDVVSSGLPDGSERSSSQNRHGETAKRAAPEAK